MRGNGSHAVAATADALTLEADLDVLPVAAMRVEGLPQHRVGLVDALQRAVGEHDAEAEGVVSPIALEDGDLDRGIEAAEQGCEEQPPGAATPPPRRAWSRLHSVASVQAEAFEHGVVREAKRIEPGLGCERQRGP